MCAPNTTTSGGEDISSYATLYHSPDLYLRHFCYGSHFPVSSPLLYPCTKLDHVLTHSYRQIAELAGCCIIIIDTVGLKNYCTANRPPKKVKRVFVGAGLSIAKLIEPAHPPTGPFAVYASHSKYNDPQISEGCVVGQACLDQ